MVYTPHNRVPSGWQFLDEDFGGIVANDPVLLSGPLRSGKTSAALRWAIEGINRDEPTLYFTSESARAVYDIGSRLRLPVKQALDEEKLVILEFTHTDPKLSASDLAAQRFAQFQAIIQQRGIKRLVVDSLIPWVLPEPPKIVAHLITDMMTQVQKMEVTALYLLPRPKSDSAAELLYILQDQVPVALSLLPQSDFTTPIVEVSRFAGRADLPAVYPVRIAPEEVMVSTSVGKNPLSGEGISGSKPKHDSSGGIKFSDELL